jgi:pyruvate formate lyase activating enzyme
MRPDGDPGVRVGGFQRFTTLDYPGQLAAVIFLQGCPLRCEYCHNPDLIPPRGGVEIEWQMIETELLRRRGFLQAVVFSGGEPLMQSGLVAAIDRVRAMGFRIGLHTSGAAPARLAALKGLVDWVGFDIKAPFEAYGPVTGVPASGLRARESYSELAAWQIPHELRTTVWPNRIGPAQVRAIANSVEAGGTEDFVLQEARHPVTGQAMGGPVFSDRSLLEDLTSRFRGFSVRRAA